MRGIDALRVVEPGLQVGDDLLLAAEGVGFGEGPLSQFARLPTDP